MFQKENLIGENIAQGLKIESPKSPHFYLKPDLHKEGVTGRPVIVSVNCHTSQISEYMNYHHQPIFREILSHVKEIITVGFVPENSYLVSLDIKSLCTRIPNTDGVKAAKKNLDNHPKQTVALKLITTFSALILRLNNFISNSKNYL